MIMKRYVIALVVIAYILFSCTQPRQIQKDKLTIATSLFPVQDIVKNISGESATVFYAVPVGANPHTFQPNPTLVHKINSADVFIGIHPEFDGWIERFLPESTSILYLSDKKEKNPHIWLSVRKIIKKAETIALFLSKIDTVNEAAYNKNAKAYISELEKCDRDLQKLFSGLSGTSFIQWHPAWNYLASDYGLTIAADMQSGHGDSLSVNKFASLVNISKQNNVRLIITGVNTESREIEALRKEIDGRVVRLDTTGDPDSDEKSNYIQLMKHNGEILSRALREEK